MSKVLVLFLAGVSSTLAAEEIMVDWFIPPGDNLPPRTAEVGDTATFVWQGFHNAFVHPTGDCTEDGAIEVGLDSGAQYTFTEDDVGEVVFACDVATHCEQGMILTFTVTEKSDTPPPPPPPIAPPPAGTPAPTPDSGGYSGGSRMAYAGFALLSTLFFLSV